jgi:hypothetical protein
VGAGREPARRCGSQAKTKRAARIPSSTGSAFRDRSGQEDDVERCGEEDEGVVA